eukprot:CAMPEP_0119492324 /NCGR_PEP_ID=MMETSP1344-20130328/16904_1 /TAXON_ID=236787 /ORGANISM="Florenciella parvula, Strain CCMP2471" /LENGTH=396 /DNA_ID=CAMNT_0007527645 /DNA_START=111 /DNA_END=1297 /DNA_ORIENTATION=+
MSSGNNALLSAAASGNVALVIRLLISPPLDVKNNIPNVNGQDPSGKTALIWAVINDRAACIPLLVGEGANMDIKDNEGKTALHWAVNSSHHNCVRELLKLNVDLGIKDSLERTPLTRAVALGNTTAMELLIQAGADVDSQDVHGRTAAFVAARRVARGDPTPKVTLKKLLIRGVDLDRQDVHKRTLTNWCAAAQKPEVLSTVLHYSKSKPNFEIQDSQQRTALDWAVYKKNLSTTRLLDEHGCDSMSVRHQAELTRARAHPGTVTKSREQEKMEQYHLPVVRRKLLAAAYREGGLDINRLFRQYDKNHDGTLSLDEFLSAIRRDMHVSPAEVSEKDLRYLFSTLDSDGGGAIEIGELVDSFQITTDQVVANSKAKTVRRQTLSDFSAADTIKTMTW